MNLKRYKYLFLDRDGVINERLPGDYVKQPTQLQLTRGCAEAIAKLRQHFEQIFVVTNQQGIGKGLMTEADLDRIHSWLQAELRNAGTYLDQIYFCPGLAKNDPPDRKPRPGMALRAAEDWPDIAFGASVMVGDSISDLLFGRRLGMKTVMITSNPEEVQHSSLLYYDARFSSLADFAMTVQVE